MTIDEPVHQENQALATTGGGASASVEIEEIEELEKLGERIAELSAQISAATYELLAMIRDFDERALGDKERGLEDDARVAVDAACQRREGSTAVVSSRLCDDARQLLRETCIVRVLKRLDHFRSVEPRIREDRKRIQ